VYARLAPFLAVLLELLELPLCLVAHGPLDGGDAVEILDLDDRRGGDAAVGLRNVQVYVGVAAQAPLLHLAIGHSQLAEQQADFLEVGAGLLRAGDLGLADDLQERSAGAIEIDPAGLSAAILVVQQLSCVLLQVHANQADAPRPLPGIDLQPAFLAERQIILADLIVLRQIGIEVVLAIPLGESGHAAVERQRRLDGKVERAPVHHRQRPRQAETNRAGRRVRRLAKRRATAAEKLCPRQELNVDFQTDDGAVGNALAPSHVSDV